MNASCPPVGCPTPMPSILMGMSQHEAATIGQAYGEVIGVLLLLMLVAGVLILTIALAAATRS